MTCQETLYKYLKENDGFHKKVHLYAVAEDWSPETVGRALRILQEEGKIKVDYYNGLRAKNLAKYAIGDYKQAKIQYTVVEKDGKIIYQQI